MVLDDQRRGEGESFAELDLVRACIAEMRSTLAIMNDAMDRVEKNQKED